MSSPSPAPGPEPAAPPGAESSDQDFLAERPRLTGLAYRILGSVVDAEDVVQEAWLRWHRADRATIERPAAWLTTTTSRLALDRLRTQRRRREEYPGPWLPEPVGAQLDAGDAVADPAARVELGESLELGFLIVLDTLAPVERVVFVLADVFAVPFADIAEVVGRSVDACRQVASRARRRVAAGRAGRRPVDEGLLGELVGAVALGEIDRVVALLAPEVVLTSDGGPRRHAARRPVVLPERVARLLVNLGSRTPAGAEMAIESVNGAPALVVRSDAGAVVVQAEAEPRHGSVARVIVLVNPDKLAGLDRVVELS